MNAKPAREAIVRVKRSLQVNLEVKAPNFTNHYFGLGNESDYDPETQDISYYRVRYNNYRFNVLLQKSILRQHTFFAGPLYESIKVEPTPGRYLTTTAEAEMQPADIFERKHYGGVLLGFDFDNRDSKIRPTLGTYWRTEATLATGLNQYSHSFSRLRTDLSFYWSFRLPTRLTLATRFGGAVNVGAFAFFQANSLGGLTNLRGYRRNRYAGRSSAYNNTELRLRLFSFRTCLFPGYFGVLGFHDVGRVWLWLDGESSGKWHQGYGAGLWVAPLKQAVVTFMYGLSPEERLPVVKLGFFF